MLGGAGESRQEFRRDESGKQQVVEVKATPLRESDDRLVGALILLRDVSELRRLETVRRDFVANVSHELKTPITAIRGLVETLVDDERMESHQQKRFLVKIRDQSWRLSSIVSDLLSLSRSESDQAGTAHQQFDLRQAVVGPARSLIPAGENRGITLHLEIPEHPITVRGDEQAVSQVTTNLVDNALKYTHHKGQVWIRVRSDDGRAFLEVQDTGIGIEEQHQSRIFERFYRVDKARSRELGGTGLGLSIVRHVVLSHGGDVGVESVPGEGTIFRVTLPLAGKTK